LVCRRIYSELVKIDKKSTWVSEIESSSEV
jgi:hypothetical protein